MLQQQHGEDEPGAQAAATPNEHKEKDHVKEEGREGMSIEQEKDALKKRLAELEEG